MRSAAVSSALLMIAAVAEAGPVWAQSDAEMAVRLSQMEEQMRQLRGQVEQLNYQVEQLQTQLAASRNTVPPDNQQPKKKKQAAAPQAEPAGQGIERIDDDVRYSEEPAAAVDQDGQPVRKAPGPKILGTISGSALQGTTIQGTTLQGSTFEGQVLVPPAAGEGQGQVVVPADSGNGLVPDSVETVSLGPAGGNDDPEAVYERSYESLLRRQFGDAETGFRSFLQKHRDHSLAGNAQYWLGETYYVQGDYKGAAQAFLVAYRDFPKSRKAADSLLKLGLSLNRLGQKQQACAAYSQVDTQFPKATEARKRAQSEMKRAGC
ncbi:MAG: tol-pal system protein YbgF [Hyphomicrobiales bacterium]